MDTETAGARWWPGPFGYAPDLFNIYSTMNNQACSVITRQDQACLQYEYFTALKV